MTRARLVVACRSARSAGLWMLLRAPLAWSLLALVMCGDHGMGTSSAFALRGSNFAAGLGSQAPDLGNLLYCDAVKVKADLTTAGRDHEPCLMGLWWEGDGFKFVDNSSSACSFQFECVIDSIACNSSCSLAPILWPRNLENGGGLIPSSCQLRHLDQVM